MQLRDDKLQIPYLDFGISLSGPSLFQLFIFYTIMTRYNALLRYDKFGKKIHTQNVAHIYTYDVLISHTNDAQIQALQKTNYNPSFKT